MAVPIGDVMAWLARWPKIVAWAQYLWGKVRKPAKVAGLLIAAALLYGCAILSAIGSAIDVLPYPPGTPTATLAPTVAPTSSPTIAPTASPTAEPTSAPTASPTAVDFQIALRYYNCGGCNPENGSGRTECKFDCTPWGTMIGFDRLPKGSGCERFSDVIVPPAQWSPRGNCLRNDSEGIPCGGAPACDPDHLLCERVSVSCGGVAWVLPPPVITSTGVTCVADLNDGFGGHCYGEPGTVYSFQADPPRPFPIPVQGNGRFWRAGTF